MAEALIFHYRHRHSLLSRTNPLTKLLSVIALCVILFTLSLTGLIIILAALIVTMWAQRLPIIRYRRELRAFTVILLLIAVTEYLSGGTLIAAMVASSRFIAIILLGLLLTDCTAADDVARSLGSLLNRLPLVNGWKVASAIEMTLALLPMIFDASLEVVTARTSRLERRRRRPLSSLISLSSSIFSLILDKAEDLALALQAREWDPSSHRRTLGYTKADVIVSCSVALLIIGAKVVGHV